MSKHPHQGKWEAIPVYDKGGAYAIMVGVAPRIAYVHAEPGSQANAHLIAAAPEMYEALKALIEFHNEGRIPSANALTLAESALAKAEQE